MTASTVAEALRQVWEGADIPAPTSLLGNISVTTAARRELWMPYSILTNLAHANFWQTVWLNRLEGKRVANFTEDWKVLPPESWPEVRELFYTDMQRALAMARSEPFAHKMKSDEAALKTLMQIAVHNAYHIGQVNLLKMQLRLGDKMARAAVNASIEE